MPRIVLPFLALAAAAPLAMLPASTVASPVAGPTFVSYPAPEGEAEGAAEPTLGVNPETGNVMYIAGLQTYRVNEFDKAGPGTSTWDDVTPLIGSLYTADPILETDTTTGRTWINQLTYSNPGSVGAYTDDDGETWHDVPYASGTGPNLDHQTVGWGPWVEGGTIPEPPTYPNAVYYCTNDIADSACALSIDGGQSFLPSKPAYLTTDCAPIHGHLKSGPDGTIYLPPDGCEATDGEGPVAGVVVSEDNSLTWEVRRVPGSLSGDGGHPSVGVATDGTIYLAYSSKGEDGLAYGPTAVARSTDKGKTWSPPVKLGEDLGVKASSFPIAVAGDPDRASVGFLGTTDDGNPRSESEFEGRWDLYISTTYDGGATWHTVNATPDNPIQVGSICTGGISCGEDRNLLDFNDMVIDEKGRVLVGLADGCTKSTCTPADREQHGLIVRQASGLGLLAEFDPKSGGPSVAPTTAAPTTNAPTAAPTTNAPTAAPTFNAPGPTTQPAHPTTGIPAVLPVVAAGVAAVAAVVVHRRRRA